MMRTQEMREISDNSAGKMNKRLDSLNAVIDEQNSLLSRMRADFLELNSVVSTQGNKTEARMEEINFRLDRILGLAQQKSVVTKSASGEKDAMKSQHSQEMESLYNASRSDYLRGEYAVAYNGFKQIYESLKTGEMAENSLYWMGMCMLDAGKKENAHTLFKSLLEKYPQSLKVCTVNFKLAGMAEEDKKTSEQKAYLQNLLGIEHCVTSNEFQRAAEILQGN
ncbi:MAG: tetratricopeptide repeat protein [Fibromonadaceae bacterium]|nr:tetratricopeptide repeat protein [Fibromonadaceae bacterium]